MEILLRKHNDQYYVWKKAEYIHGTYYVIEDAVSVSVPQAMIVAVKKDDNSDYVMCKNCGAIIKNDKESIEDHYAEEEAKRNCAKCGNVRFRNRKVSELSWEHNADGSYSVTEHSTSNIVCSIGYLDEPIDSNAAKNRCMYNRCRQSGVGPVDDVLLAKPGLFDTFVTVDTLIAKKFDKVEYHDNHFEYDLKSRGTLQACVNELGIVDHFRLYYRYRAYNIFYSKKYNEMFFTDDYRKYTTIRPYGVTEKKASELKKKIASLYEEANK